MKQTVCQSQVEHVSALQLTRVRPGGTHLSDSPHWSHLSRAYKMTSTNCQPPRNRHRESSSGSSSSNEPGPCIFAVKLAPTDAIYCTHAYAVPICQSHAQDCTQISSTLLGSRDSLNAR